MILLHIEHMTFDFDAWKKSFDSFEELRQKSGVRRYHVLRSIDNPNYVMIDLEFDSVGQAESLLGNVQQVWQHAIGTLIKDPNWRISEVVDTQVLQR